MRQNQQRGFTLIELSIVLVVIGLIIGSVLVAVNIINNAKITNTINLIQSVQSAISTYNQNYGALPGDDTQAVARFSSKGVANNGGGNGVIGAATLSATFAGGAPAADGNGAYESAMLWAHLRAAGLVRGDGANVVPPGNPYGGVIGVQNGAFTTNGITLGTNVLCVNNIRGEDAIIIDQRLDDGVATTGNIRGGTSVIGAAAAYVNGTASILCTGI